MPFSSQKHNTPSEVSSQLPGAGTDQLEILNFYRNLQGLGQARGLTAFRSTWAGSIAHTWQHPARTLPAVPDAAKATANWGRAALSS